MLDAIVLIFEIFKKKNKQASLESFYETYQLQSDLNEHLLELQQFVDKKFFWNLMVKDKFHLTQILQET